MGRSSLVDGGTSGDRDACAAVRNALPHVTLDRLTCRRQLQPNFHYHDVSESSATGRGTARRDRQTELPAGTLR